MDRTFGEYRLAWWARTLVSLCQMMPGNGFGKKIAFLARKPVLKLNADPMDVCVKGLRLRLYPSANLSDKRLLSTPFLLDGVERQHLAELLPPEAHVVDVGANVGGYSILLLQQRPDLHVLAIEADPRLAARLSDNLKLNDLQNRCTVRQLAVTDKQETVCLYRNHENQGKNSLQTDGPEGSTSDSIDVPGQPLLEILNSAQIDRPDLVKMDIEGYELPVLQTFLETAPSNRWPRYLQIEQYRNEELNAAVKLCLERGYQILLRTRMNVVLEYST
ncbi:MAG: FkbM family methyltransferase [Planctomycetes bacterium]|nr:FkbM family methyltransferase [Planctomycetota bacterium]